MEEYNIKKVTIVGAGVQGSMQVLRFAVFGKEVSFFDVDEKVFVTAFLKINHWLQDYIDSGRLTKKEAEAATARIRSFTDLKESLADADLVIENVPERLSLKQQVWQEIDQTAPKKTIIATNSSSMKSSEIGINVARKDKTLNLNFANPVKDDLVEVMWNSNTSESTKTAVLELLRSVDCVPIVTKKEIMGYSMNRVWRAIKKECLKLWAGGYIEPENLDKAFIMEWNTEIGPFALMDKVGLDVVRDIEMNYYRESGDKSDLPPKELDEMISRGFLGEKTGRGFYSYTDTSK